MKKKTLYTLLVQPKLVQVNKHLQICLIVCSLLGVQGRVEKDKKKTKGKGDLEQNNPHKRARYNNS